MELVRMISLAMEDACLHDGGIGCFESLLAPGALVIEIAEGWACSPIPLQQHQHRCMSDH